MLELVRQNGELLMVLSYQVRADGWVGVGGEREAVRSHRMTTRHGTRNKLPELPLEVRSARPRPRLHFYSSRSVLHLRHVGAAMAERRGKKGGNLSDLRVTMAGLSEAEFRSFN